MKKHIYFVKFKDQQTPIEVQNSEIEIAIANAILLIMLCFSLIGIPLFIIGIKNIFLGISILIFYFVIAYTLNFKDIHNDLISSYNLDFSIIDIQSQFFFTLGSVLSFFFYSLHYEYALLIFSIIGLFVYFFFECRFMQRHSNCLNKLSDLIFYILGYIMILNINEIWYNVSIISVIYLFTLFSYDKRHQRLQKIKKELEL